jgi:hypothetical protein
MTSNIPDQPAEKTKSEMTTIVAPPANPSAEMTTILTSPPESSSTSQQLWQGLKKQIASLWQKVASSNPSQVTPIIVATILAVPFLLVLSGVSSFLNSLPLVPDLLELIGLIYLLWFAYRYLLFAESRQELLKTIDGIKKKVLG